MAFPVDILKNVDQESLELAAEEYFSRLPYRSHDPAEYLSLPDSKQIEIGLHNVSFVPLYGTDTKKKLLALFSADDCTKVVGLYLLGQWWGVEDVLKTAEPSKTGLIKVSTLGERIVLYVLNRIVLRNEKSSGDVSFLCHCEHESAKILWKDGEAIGFYSYKPKGSLSRNFLTQCYQLPVMDTVFVRKCHRGKGHGIKILEDFVGSFRKELIGLKFPLSEAMYKVCEKYFSIYPADKEFMWEVEETGRPYQRTLIAKRLPKLKLKAEKDQVVNKLNFEEEDVTASMEIEKPLDIQWRLWRRPLQISPKAKVDNIPATRRGRSSGLKRRGIRGNSEERLSKNIRVEDIEAGVESPIEVATEEHLDDTFSVKESETLRSTTDTITANVTNISEVRSSQKEEEQEIEKDKITATSEGTPVTHLTTAGEIKNQGGSEKECELVDKEHTVVMQGATIGCIDQSQLQSVVDIEIVKMSTGTEEEQIENLEKNKEVEEDKPLYKPEKEEVKQMLDKPEEEKAVSRTETYNSTQASEGVTDQSGTPANKPEESEVEEYKETTLTVKTHSTMDVEITEVGETLDAVSEISETDKEEAPQQSSVKSAELNKLQTTPEEDEERVENTSMMLILKEDKVTPEQSTRYGEQEGEPEPETTEVVLLSQVEKPEEKTDTEQAQEGAQNLYVADKLSSKQGKQSQKKGSIDTPSRSTRLIDQPVDPDVMVRCLRSTLKPIKITPVRRSTRSKAVIQKVEGVTDENPERGENTAEGIGLEESETANTNVDETVIIVSGSPEATEIVYKEKKSQIKEATEGNIPLVEAELDEDVTEKVRYIKKMQSKEAGQTDSGIEMSSLAQEKDVHEEEASVRTERSLRRRTIIVQSPLRSKSRRAQKQEAEADVEHQETNTVVTKSKTKSISTTEERVEEMYQEVHKMENKEAKLAELEPVEKTDMIRNDEDKKTLASSEETVNICLPIITTETSFKSLDDMETLETTAVDTEKSELLVGVEIDDQKTEAEPDEETGIEGGSSVIKLQKATVVLVDLNKFSQNTEESETPEVLKHSQMEENLELDKPDKDEQELHNLASEVEEQKEELQTQEDTEIILEEEKIEEEKSTVEGQNKLDEQDMTFEEQKPTEDLATMSTQRNLVESNKNENNRNKDELKEAEPEENEVEKEAENKETHLAVTKDTVEVAPEMGEEEHLELKKNEQLVENQKETGETENPTEVDPVANREQTYVIEETAIQVEEMVSNVERTETILSGNARITRRSLRLGAKLVTESKQKRRKSTHLHKAELVSVKEADISGNKYEETSAKTEETVNVCIPVITEETNLENPDETTYTNIEKTLAVEPEASVVLMGVETDDKNEAPKILDEATFIEAKPDEKVEKDDNTLIIHMQKATVVLVDFNNLSQNTEGDCDTPEISTDSKIEEQLELNEPERIQTSEDEEQPEEPQKEEDTEKNPEEEEKKIEEENTVEEHNNPDKQDITFEEQKLTEDVEKTNYVKVTEIVEEYKAVIDEDVEESVTSKEHSKATTMGENYHEKHIHSDIEIDGLIREAPEALQVLVSTERSLRRRTIKVQSPPRRKSRRLQKQEAEADVEHQETHTVVSKSKTESISMTEETVEKMDQEVNKTENKEANLAELEPVEDDTEKIIPLVEGKSHEDVIEKGFEEINNMENKETSLQNDAAIELNAIQVEEKVTQIESSENNVNEKNKALLDKSTDDEDDVAKSSIKTTENENQVEMDKTQKVVEGGVQDPPQKNTDQKQKKSIKEKREDEISSGKENATQQESALSKEENVVETKPTNELTTAVEEKVVLDSSIQEEPLITRRSLRYRTVTKQSTPRRQSKRLHRQELESEKETKNNICGDENDSEIQKSADDLNIPIEKENKALNAEESIAELENFKTKEEEGIIQENIECKAKETGAKDDSVEEGNEILFEINESNRSEDTEQNKTQEENLERDVQVPKEQQDSFSSVQEEEKPPLERENEEAVQGSSFGIEETAVERRTLRKRLTVEIAAPRKSKRLCKQEHDEDSERVKEAVMEQTETVEVIFTADNVELSSDVPAAVFEDSNLGGEKQQNIQKNAEGTKSDGDWNIQEDTKTDAGEFQEEQKEKSVNKPQTDEDNKEVTEQNSKKVEETGEMLEVIEQHVETEKQKLESSTNEGFTLQLEVEETSNQEEKEADEESRGVLEAPKDIFTSAEKSDKGEENISDEDEKGFKFEKYVLQSNSSTSSTRRRSTRLQMHEPKNQNTKEDESDSDESVQQTPKDRHQIKRKAITDLTPARRSKRLVRAKIV